MGRWANYPTPIEDLRSFDISFLSKYQYCKPNQTKSGTITWTSPHGAKNSIGIKVKTNDDDGILNLDYTFNSTIPINYNIKLISRPSNLGAGLLWFFVCPYTGKVCRKLHLINGYFKHRSALQDLMYQNQLESKRWREWNKMYAGEFKDHIYTELFSKYFKRYYKGKMTKRFSRIVKKLQKSGNFNIEDI